MFGFGKKKQKRQDDDAIRRSHIDAGLEHINSELDTVNSELRRSAAEVSLTEYGLAVGCGVLAGLIDALYVGDSVIRRSDVVLSHQQMNRFIQQYARSRGIPNERLKDAIVGLENEFKVLQDNIWKEQGIGVAAKTHHLADLAHHPTPVGLLASLAVQFLRVGVFVNKDGEWHFLPVETSRKDLLEVYAPVVIAGVLNWLVSAAGQADESEAEKLPDSVKKLLHLAASTPLIIEIAKCADNWAGHLVSDMGGSRNTPGGGMGIPGVLTSLLYEISSLPVLKDTDLPKIVNNLYKNYGTDLRSELPIYKLAARQAVPVVFMELFVRLGFFVTRLSGEIGEHGNVREVNWDKVLPVGNRSVDRLLAIANMTFSVADTADAAVRAAVESGGNWVLFSGTFVTRVNYVAAGRTALAVKKELSQEDREIELLHEKRLLSEAKAVIYLERVQEYKAQLEAAMIAYLNEDLEIILSGFDTIEQGLSANDSNLVIRGNNMLQRMLGEKPQFTNQAEFDDLMESDTPFRF